MSLKEKSKPADVLEKIICEKIARFVNEVGLCGRRCVPDPDETVEAVLKAVGTGVMKRAGPA